MKVYLVRDVDLINGDSYIAYIASSNEKAIEYINSRGIFVVVDGEKYYYCCDGVSPDEGYYCIDEKEVDA